MAKEENMWNDIFIGITIVVIVLACFFLFMYWFMGGFSSGSNTTIESCPYCGGREDHCPICNPNGESANG
jgi:hypothetical protein